MDRYLYGSFDEAFYGPSAECLYNMQQGGDSCVRDFACTVTTAVLRRGKHFGLYFVF